MNYQFIFLNHTLCCTKYRAETHDPTQLKQIRWTPSVGYLTISTVVRPSHFRKLQSDFFFFFLFHCATHFSAYSLQAEARQWFRASLLWHGAL